MMGWGHVRKIARLLNGTKDLKNKIYTVVRYLLGLMEGALGGAGVGGYRDKEKFLTQLSNLRYLDNYDLNIRLDKDAGKTVWFFFNEVNAEYVFGGWIAVLQFMKELKSRSINIGVLTRSKPENVASHQLLAEVLDGVSVMEVKAGDELHCGKNDVFCAYDWVTSYILLQAKRKFSPDLKLFYFCQEDEEIFYPNCSTGSLVRSVQESFVEREITPIFNSAQLRAHFAHKLDSNAINDFCFFEQAIPRLRFAEGERGDADQAEKYLLVYGRPEAHAARNMFELAILALHKAIIKKPDLFKDIQIVSIGSGMLDHVDLPYDKKIIMKDRMPYADYLAIVKRSAAIISLMNAPHPSVPPFESVRNGVRAVVNCGIYGRTAGYYKSMSPLFYPALGNSEDLSDAIILAIEDWLASNEAVGGSPDGMQDKLPHPTRWEDAFRHLFERDNDLMV